MSNSLIEIENNKPIVYITDDFTAVNSTITFPQSIQSCDTVIVFASKYGRNSLPIVLQAGYGSVEDSTTNKRLFVGENSYYTIRFSTNTKATFIGSGGDSVPLFPYLILIGFKSKRIN